MLTDVGECWLVMSQDDLYSKIPRDFLRYGSMHIGSSGSPIGFTGCVSMGIAGAVVASRSLLLPTPRAVPALE